MGFLRKNIGLVAFLILSLGVVIYYVMKIADAGKLRSQNKEKREGHLKLLQDIKRKNVRLDDENLEKAQKVAEEAKQKYRSFVSQLASKCLLPGVDFSKDPDEEGADKAEPETDEDGKPIVKVDRFKNNPNRIVFDGWMTGSLMDARETLTNELIKTNLVNFKSENDEDEEDEEDELLAGKPNGRQSAAGDKKDGKDDAKDKDAKKLNVKASRKDAADGKTAQKGEDAKTEEEKKAISDTKAELDKGKSTYEVEKEKRLKLVKGASVPEYFMFTEYVTNRESGLRSNKEKRGVFRQLLLLNELIKIMRNAEIAALDAIDFPCGLDILDGDKFTFTPITITVTANPERIEAFLNQLNANEDYIFYLRDITSFDATVKLNADPSLEFNSDSNSGYAKLDGFLKQAGTQVESVGGGGRGGRGDMDDMGGGRRRRNRDRGPQNMDRMEGGMAGGDMEKQAQEIIRTRKFYRVFADAVEKKAENRGERGGMAGEDEKSKSSSAEKGTTVTLSLNFEFVEFKPLGD